MFGDVSRLLPKSVHEMLVVSYVGCNKIVKSLFTVVFSYAAFEMGVTLPETFSGS